MLTLLTVTNSRDQEEVFKTFDPDIGTWLVSDLKTKLDLNRRLLRARDFIPGESLLRASELWRKLLARVRPDLQIVSRDFALTLLSQKLAASGIDWVQAPGAAQTAANYLTQFMPILAHPDGEEMMGEWLQAQPASHARWGRWFDLSLQLWREFLDDGFIAPAWASGVLVNETAALTKVWSRPLHIDLGAELNQVEADLLIQLSGQLDVFILRPQPEWGGEYRRALTAYELFDRQLKVERHRVVGAGLRAPDQSFRTFRKYTTMIAEVKGAVAQARSWLDGGRDLTDIAIVAPDIEAYWPALSAYLDEEGIPCQKDRVRRLHSYPDVTRFLAHLRLRTGSFDEADIELGIFASEGAGPKLISYDRFKTLYGTLYSREDVGRADAVRAKFRLELDPAAEVPRDEFVQWSLRQLPEDVDLKRVESLFKQLFSEVPQALRLPVQRWITHLEQLAGRVECKIRDGHAEGLAVLNLSSAHHSPASRMMILGLTEAALKPAGGTAVLHSDIWLIGQQFGFHLASEDQARLEFEARWLTENTDRELILCVPETDFGGAAQAASWLWIRGSREAGQGREISIPDPTRWDELQQSDLAEMAQARRWSPGQLALVERSFLEDLGEKPYASFGEDLVTTLSPSGIEDYLNCPFVFAAKRLMGLSDIPELDLEIDASRRGSLMHKLFEFLTIEPMRFDLGQGELEALVEKAREESHLELADERLWPPLKVRQVDLARRFLAFEKDLRASFPHSRVLGREVDIAGYIRPRTGELVAEPEAGAIKFQGRIDRIDTDDAGNLAIYDYKSSLSTAAQYTSWCKNNRIQLLLYAIAVEKGLTSFSPKPVQSAIYYSARPLSRDYGYKVEDVSQGLFATNDRKKNKLKEDGKVQLFKEGEGLVQKAVEGIRSGRFDPSPQDPKDCATCQWSAVCRAPHLNT